VLQRSATADGASRRITRPEIKQTFADGWQINSIEPSRYVTTELADRAIAWLSDLTRL
jgi:hypothetical protein